LKDAFLGALKENRQSATQKPGRTSSPRSIPGRPHGNLVFAIRLFVLDHYRAKTNGHAVESSGRDAAMVMPAAANQFCSRNEESSGGPAVCGAAEKLLAPQEGEHPKK